LRPIESLT